MPQFMANEMPDCMSDDEREMNHMMSPYSVVSNISVNVQFQLYFEYE